MSGKDQVMDSFLANYFDTGQSSESQATPSAEDHEKVAQAEMFAKLAAAEGIDVTKMNDAQIEWLWNKTFDKTAQPQTTQAQPQSDDGDKLAAAAREEHAAKLAAAERFSEAEQFGKTAAHSYVAELKKIAAAGGLNFGVKTAEFPPKKDDDKGEKKDEKKDGDKGDGDKKLPPFMQEKKGSFDLAAANSALKQVVEAGNDEKVANARLTAVLTLGLQESAKTAGIKSYEQALQVRALEFCEAAGYPVQWGG